MFLDILRVGFFRSELIRPTEKSKFRSMVIAQKKTPLLHSMIWDLTVGLYNAHGVLVLV